MAAPIKMDELLVTWLGSDEVYENVLNLIEKYRVQRQQQQNQIDSNNNSLTPPGSPKQGEEKDSEPVPSSPRGLASIPPFYPLKTPGGATIQRRRKLPRQSETWEPLPAYSEGNEAHVSPEIKGNANLDGMLDEALASPNLCVRDQVKMLVEELGIVTPSDQSPSTFQASIVLPLEVFIRITKEVCHFPSFFNGPLYQRMIDVWNMSHPNEFVDAVTLQALEWFWKQEMEPYDPPERFFRLVKQPDKDCILRDDFLPYIKALLNDHPVRRH
jgi:EF-hand domain